METADSVEKALERLMPRGMSERATGALESMIDELAGEAPARPDWARIGIWSTGAVAAVLLGAAYRRQAPVMIGGAVLAVLAVRELVAVWDLLPRWSFLAVGGLALITLAVTYERRRRDLRRLRTVVGRMT